MLDSQLRAAVDSLTDRHVSNLVGSLYNIRVLTYIVQYINLLNESGLEPIVTAIEGNTSEVGMV